MTVPAVAVASDTVVVHRSRRKMLLALLTAAGFAAAGVGLVLYPDPQMPRWAALACAALFAPVAVLALVGLLGGGTAILTFTPEGLRDGRLSADVIP